MNAKLRAPFRYFGGKGRMTSKLLPLIPPGGMPYCEPYCGAASIFFARDPAPNEVLNDLNQDVVNVFRVLQDKDAFERFRHRVMWTPYARGEFERAISILQESSDLEDRAWAFFVVTNFSLGGRSSNMRPSDFGRAFVSSGGVANTVNKWMMRQSMIDAWRWRLMRAQIDCRDAIDVIKYWDNPDAIFYIDPPYVLDTRKTIEYKHEASDEHHKHLVETLLNVKGSVVLSGYDHEIYEPLVEAGWEKSEFKTACHAAGRVRSSGLQGNGSALNKVSRVEVVWRNPKAVSW